MRTYIIRAFIPWLIYLAFADGSVLGLKIAAVGGLLSLFLFNWRALRQKFLFDWASVVFFVGMWLAGVGLGETLLVKYSLLLAYLFLSFVSFLSLLLHVPVALQHAKSKVSVIYWDHPIFIGMNYWLTIFWGVVFLLAAFSTLLFAFGIGSELVMISIIPIILLISGLLFTAIFPDGYKKKMTKIGTVAALPGLSEIIRVKVGVGYLAYRTLGQGPLLVMIHGALMNMHHWDPELLRQLSLQFKVIIFDYPGIGYSDDQQMQYTAKQIATCLKTMLDVEKLTPEVVLGYSLGGAIAQSFATLFPTMLKRLILIATNAGGSSALLRDQSADKKFNFTGANREDYDKVLELYFPESVRERFKDKMYQIYDGAVFEGVITDEMIKKEGSLREAWNKDDDHFEKLKQLKLPILLIAGKEDLLVPVDNTLLMQKHLKHARKVVYNDAGHGVIYQYPKDVADQIRSHFD